MAALPKILCQAADENVVVVEHYLKAAGEALALTFVGTGVLTAAFQPDSLVSNPLKDRLGYNNPCVLFDLPPASWLGATGIAFTVYLVCMFTRLDTRRLRLDRDRLPPWFVAFTLVLHYAFALSMCMFVLVFVVPPSVSVWGHTGLFIQFIVFRWAAVATNFYEAALLQRPIPYPSRVFIALYTLVTAALPVLYAINYAMYDIERRSGEDPYLPWWLTCAVDYTWFACLALTTKMLPESPALRETFSLTDRVFELPNGRHVPLPEWRSAANAPVAKAGPMDAGTSGRQSRVACPVLAALYRHKALTPDEQGVVPWVDLARAVSTYTGCRGDVLEKILEVAFKDTSEDFKENGCQLFELHGHVNHGYSTGCRANPDAVDARLFDEIVAKYAVDVDAGLAPSPAAAEAKAEVAGEDSKKRGEKRIYLNAVHDIATYTREGSAGARGACCTVLEEKKATISFSALFEAFQRREASTGRPYLSVDDLRCLLLDGRFPEDFVPHEWGLKDILDEIAVVACGCPACCGECAPSAHADEAKQEELERLTTGRHSYSALEIQRKA